MGEPKKYGWAFWVSLALIGICLLYVGSFGPACWWASRTTQAGNYELADLYRPLWWTIEHDTPLAGTILRQYVRIGLPPRGVVSVPAGTGGWVQIHR